MARATSARAKSRPCAPPPACARRGEPAEQSRAAGQAEPRAREFEETETKPAQEREEVAEVFRGYGLSEEAMQPILDRISADRTRWVDFMMRFELGLAELDPRRARRSALTIASA